MVPSPKPKATRRSPAMEQFFRAKEQYPDTILFFRMGDFYEMFYEDAVLASELLEIALTSRGSDADGIAIPMAGVPHHAASSYIAKLIEKGQRVAICEQMVDPSTVRGVVPREVIRVVTPGLVLDPDALDARTNNYLAAVIFRQERYGFAALELTTAEVRACELVDRTDALAELVRMDAKEVLLHQALEKFRDELQTALSRSVFRMIGDQQIESAVRDESVRAMIESASADATGVGAQAISAAAVVLRYAQETQPGVSLDIQRIAPYDLGGQLALDDAAVRNLEIVRTLTGERRGSLVDLVDVTQTAMGARAIRQRLLAPLADVAAIRRRHDSVEALRCDALLRNKLRETLREVADLERLATRASMGVATPRDLGAVRASLRAAGKLVREIAGKRQRSTDDALDGLMAADLCEDILRLLSDALLEELPLVAINGGVFLESFDSRIAELRRVSDSSKDVILAMERRERERTGINSLRIRFTRVFGYYIEVTRSNLKAVPADYQRKQTVAGGERYTTESLNELQAQILNADERLCALESELFQELRRRVGEHSPRLRALAAKIADLDVHAAFADIAHRLNYVRPQIDDSCTLDFKAARHPIVEQTVARGRFVPNDIRLDVEGQRLMVITGPNMAGKSTAMRQVALAVILAQAGGFVPASEARIGIVDKIYTRVGASDALARGQSTFMVEMRESANILRGATRRSLVILDEIGRGTSTYDGLAIAWAVAEHLHDVVGCRTMFATHYHELCELAATRDGVINCNVAAKEYKDDVVFLHKLVPGSANRSYGVAVASLAGIPTVVLARAKAILKELETGAALPSGAPASLRKKNAHGAVQLEMFSPYAPQTEPSKVEAALRELSVENITPVDALVVLAKLKELLSEK
ncbi:MAG: DNA mismatch repair protein MutS [Deltaproteobacteria bacterium]|nr:DNA mismatch repair protein MutS [Deltaproteobacteria bacterium]